MLEKPAYSSIAWRIYQNETYYHRFGTVTKSTEDWLYVRPRSDVKFLAILRKLRQKGESKSSIHG